jgi:hypothetical protein
LEKLFTAQTTNDTTASNIITATGRELTVQAWGTWGGATLSVYLSVDGTNGVLLTDLTLTADGMVAIQVPSGNRVWATLTGVGTSSVNCWINGQGKD